MRLSFYQVDAFTGSPFRGNPAGVVVMKEWLSETTMQAIAAENNLSETAFIHPRGNAFEIRWFTPEVEVDLCGHGTLASAFVAFDRGLTHGDEVQFAAKVGVLTVRREGALLVMDFPALPAEPIEVTSALTDALGATSWWSSTPRRTWRRSRRGSIWWPGSTPRVLSPRPPAATSISCPASSRRAWGSRRIR
jgi:PhzF family phenazine biosynthesis protein